MTFIVNLSCCNQQSNILKAVKTLKKADDRLPVELPNGTKVSYVRGENFEARGFGNKFSLYKEIIRQDGTKYVTNANVIGDKVYINEVCCGKKSLALIFGDKSIITKCNN